MEDKDLRSVNEIGKIFNSLTDKKILCDFFLDTVGRFIESEQGGLFLSASEDKIWIEATLGEAAPDQDSLRSEAQTALKQGKPVSKGSMIFVPLIVRNAAMGIAYFMRPSGKPPFQDRDLAIAFDLSAQMASALKNTLLFEQNLEMAKLAAIGQSMGMVLHEIKNIMQLAIFAQEWLRRGAEKKNFEYLDRGISGIEKAMKEMDGFVYEILSLTKSYKIDPQKIDLKTLIEELGKDLQEKARQFRVQLDFQVEEGFPEVSGERRTLYRALLNLVKNAMEACNKDESCIRLRVRSRDEVYYEIIIEDNGQGMSDEVKAKLLQAFFSTKGERGTGLGLMMVDRTLKAHGGKMKVDSVLGQGTTFTLTLPKVIQAAAK
ncbi:MAG: ATP-binding protein [Candidatus Omnitrophica bacterium]|nr:ATP-binding protein [Candidatus Omnitrophota bacterium]